MEKPDPSFIRQMLSHLESLKVLYRNKYGANKRKFYTDFVVRGPCTLPCGCNVGQFKPAHFRIYEDATLRHHGCDLIPTLPDKVMDNVQGIILTSNAERRRVPKCKKSQPEHGVYSWKWA